MTCILPEEYDRSPRDAADDTMPRHTHDGGCAAGDSPYESELWKDL